MIQLFDLAVGYAARRGECRAVASAMNAEALPGQLTCLIGRNGTGKTTLLRTIARFLPALAGRVHLCRRDAALYGRTELARTLSVVLTDRVYADEATARQVAELGRVPYTGFWGALSKDDSEAVDRAMRLAGVEELAERRFSSLSDGERQRVMVAKALAQEAKVMLLDEPAAHLDYPSRVELTMLLRRIARDTGATVLLSTHDLEVALGAAHRLWVTHDGGMSQGTPQSLAADGTLQRYVGGSAVSVNPDTLAVAIDARHGEED